jgi:hypothetical protein
VAKKVSVGGATALPGQLTLIIIEDIGGEEVVVFGSDEVKLGEVLVGVIDDILKGVDVAVLILDRSFAKGFFVVLHLPVGDVVGPEILDHEDVIGFHGLAEAGIGGL